MTLPTNIPLRTCDVSRKDNMIVIYFKNDITLEVEDINNIHIATTQLCNGECLPYLVIPGIRMSVSKEGRQVNIMEQRSKNTLCEAMVINNLATRLAARLYYRFNKTPFPVRHFETEQMAIKWLNSQRNNDNEGTELHTRSMV